MCGLVTTAKRTLWTPLRPRGPEDWSCVLSESRESVVSSHPLSAAICGMDVKCAPGLRAGRPRPPRRGRPVKAKGPDCPCQRPEGQTSGQPTAPLGRSGPPPLHRGGERDGCTRAPQDCTKRGRSAGPHGRAQTTLLLNVKHLISTGRCAGQCSPSLCVSGLRASL